MEVHFRNSRGPRIWIAIMRYAPGICPEGNGWLTEGWWSVNQGETVHAFNTDNRYFGYYAEADDGAMWGGALTMSVYRNAFSECHDSPSTLAYAIVGVRGGDGGNSDRHTVNLV